MQKSFAPLFVLFSALFFIMADKARAGVAYSDPPGGWTFLYQGTNLIVGAEDSGFTSLDGS